MTNSLTTDTLIRAPKVLLHDHLDGGVRPATVVELAAETGYEGLPTTDVGDLSQWFYEAANSGSLERYLETFAHTVGVMQTPEALRRIAAECAEDLARGRGRVRRGALRPRAARGKGDGRWPRSWRPSTRASGRASAGRPRPVT